MAEFLSTWIRVKPLKISLLCAAVSAACLTWLESEAQRVGYDPTNWSHFIPAIGALFGALIGFFLFIASPFSASAQLDRKRYSLALKIGHNTVSIRHDDHKDIFVGAPFSQGTELVADPQKFVDAVNQGIERALPDISSHRFKVYLTVQLMDEVEASYGQARLIGSLTRCFKACEVKLEPRDNPPKPE